MEHNLLPLQVMGEKHTGPRGYSGHPNSGSGPGLSPISPSPLGRGIQGHAESYSVVWRVILTWTLSVTKLAISSLQNEPEQALG